MNQLLEKLKGVHKSIQVWFNSIVGLVTVAIPYLVDAAPQLQVYLPTNIYRTTMAILVAGNILIHFRPTTRTDDPPKGDPHV